MPFGTATVLTNSGKNTAADRQQTTPARSALKFVAMGTGATGAARTAVVADTALSTQVETRTSGTESIVTTTVTGDSYQVVGTVTATASRSVDEAGTFDASSAGNMGVSATFTVIPLATGDSIQFTIKTVFS
jgi:hypothetical protein